MMHLLCSGADSSREHKVSFRMMHLLCSVVDSSREYKVPFRIMHLLCSGVDSSREYKMQPTQEFIESTCSYRLGLLLGSRGSVIGLQEVVFNQTWQRQAR